MSISLSFDVGHSSIGWAALRIANDRPQVLGCGSVVFPSEDCQNQQRAGFRRQRRHIAATRNRIRRIEKCLLEMGVLSVRQLEECRETPSPWPWLFAAQVIQADRILNWPELWAVIRWYAHNRGYDGNALWAGEGSDLDDVKKVKAASKLMSDCDQSTMCETICAFLGVDPLSKENPVLRQYFKGENAAFPRNVVVGEMRLILEAHLGKLEGLGHDFIDSLLTDWKLAQGLGFDAKLPERYCGGLLFGQLKPRFENRIIPICRITGEKTPSKHSRAFYRYRWAMLMNNLRVADAVVDGARALNVAERIQLNAVMEATGFLTKATLKKALEKTLKLEPTNLDAMFLVPEMEQALTLDPAKKEVSGKILKIVWKHIPEEWQSCFLNQLFTRRNYQGVHPSLSQWRTRILQKGASVEKLDADLQAAYEAENKVLAKKGFRVTLEEFCARPIRIANRHMASGRAPYAKAKLIEAYEFVMCGKDPRSVGGPLEETEEVRSNQRDREIDQSSNNHLLRHRLKIFTRTLADLVKRYADGDPLKVSSVGVEVVRDLVQFSGKTAKEKAQIIGKQLWHHRKIEKFLEDTRDETGGNWEITRGLIQKVRIADDLGWTCPYSGKSYDLSQILSHDVDKEHIIPRSKRPTDSLHALVLSYSKTNSDKGNRTALQFIEDTADSTETFCPKKYREFVSKLRSKNGPSKDDELRCTKRKIALLTRDYEPRGKAKQKSEAEVVSNFTEGSLTQTSYLNKLASQQVYHWFASQLEKGADLPPVIQLAGSVTSATRRSWNLFDQLNEVCPETRGKIKTDIREITHLHHALDAIVIGLSVHYFPKDGRLWALMSRRKITNPDDQLYMRRVLGSLVSFSSKGNWQLKELDDDLKAEIAKRLAEKRVVRHNPKTMRGLRVQQNIWRVEGEDPEDDSKMLITMRPRNEEGVKIRKNKQERKTKLFGSNPVENSGKLKKLRGAIIVEDNYGVALDPVPKVIPYQQVWKQLKALRAQNNGESVRLLRNGDVISVGEGRYKGLWRVHSIKDANMGLVLDVAAPELVRAENGVTGAKMNVRLKTLLASGLTVLRTDFSASEC